jgi:hypothetical protein
MAKQNNYPVDFYTLASINLAKKDPKEILLKCLEPQQYVIETFSPDRNGEIFGWTKDQTRVRSKCELFYRLPINHAFGWTLTQLHQQLATKGAYPLF